MAFYTPDKCFQETEKHLAVLLERRKIEATKGFTVLEQVKGLRPVELGDYAEFESQARARIQLRDPDDWPVVAVALAVGCPIWTEDKDFFGSGIATWTTDRVELYLESTV